MQDTRYIQPTICKSTCRQLVVLGCLFFAGACVSDRSDYANDRRVLDRVFANLVQENGPPPVYNMRMREDGLHQLYLGGAPYKDSPTRIFAIYGRPDRALASDRLGNGKIPAVVLVHGGGGTAFAEWVRRWNKAGFAAIAVAVEGQTDVVADMNLNGSERWERHAHSGPRRAGIYTDFAEEVGDEWMFHAVFSVIQANNFLRKQIEVDATSIGIVGISWGGVITATTLGFDQRFAYAIPIYGSGHLRQLPNQYGRALAANPEYSALWEPQLRLHRYEKPSLWLTGRNENHFYLPAQAATYSDVRGNVSISIKPEMTHGHDVAWNELEPYEFAREIVLSGQVPFEADEAVIAADGSRSVSFRISEDFSLLSSTGFVTTYQDSGPDAVWQEVSVNIVRTVCSGTVIEASVLSLPDEWAHWFINLSLLHRKSGSHVTASSRLVSARSAGN